MSNYLVVYHDNASPSQFASLHDAEKHILTRLKAHPSSKASIYILHSTASADIEITFKEKGIGAECYMS